LPEEIRTEWAPKSKDGVVALGLQDAYALLAALKDPLGEKFEREGLSGKESPLTARNGSILAHGFEPVSEGVVGKLWTAALSLADVEEASLPSFMTLGEGLEH
jgi:hypothetical protein